MKNYLALFALTVSCFFGASDSHAAVAVQTIAEVATYGGFSPQPGLRSGMRILDNGYVIQYYGQDSSYVARLSMDKVKALKSQIDQTQASELQLEDPDAPICMDAPSTSYKVRQSNGKTIEIALQDNCRMSYLKNGEGRFLVDVLEGLHKLSYLRN
jgi:hypothetical protein